MTDAPATIGHNAGPVVLPKDEEMLADLQRRYPEIDKRIAEWEDAFKGFPDELTLDQGDVAASLQDLIGQVRKEVRVWEKSHAPGEKGPLNKLVKIVTNFFATRVERADALLEVWAPRHQAYLDKKKVETARKMEEEAQRQREAADAARLAREKAEEEQREAEARAAEERRKEQEARAAAERAAQERAAAEARAAAAKEEERQLAAEKAARDKTERENNALAFRAIKTHMKEVERLNLLAEADEATEEELTHLDLLARAGGVIGNLASPVANSPLLDEEQKTSIEATRVRLGELRKSYNERLDKRARARREKEAAVAAEREASLAEERRIAREAEDARMAVAKANREREEAAADAAKEEKRKAEQAARDARSDARSAESGAKASGKYAARHGADAERSENRATRVENRLENSTDADLSRTRGELGTTGSLTRRWNYYITDEIALRAGFYCLDPKAIQPLCADLAAHLTTTALEGAVFHWMRAHQAGWAGMVRVENMLPGVVFVYEQEARIA